GIGDRNADGEAASRGGRSGERAVGERHAGWQRSGDRERVRWRAAGASEVDTEWRAVDAGRGRRTAADAEWGRLDGNGEVARVRGVGGVADFHREGVRADCSWRASDNRAAGDERQARRKISAEGEGERRRTAVGVDRS